MACTRRWASDDVVPGYEAAEGMSASKSRAGCSRDEEPVFRMEKTFEFVGDAEESNRGMGNGNAVRFACFLRIFRAASAFANWN